MDDLLAEFLAETVEGIEVLDAELVRLEQNPNDPALLGNIFRVLHTIKGTSGFLDLPRLEAVAHSGENVLGKFRDGELEVTPDAVSIILEAMDTIKSLVSEIGDSGHEPAGDDSDLIARLDATAEGKAHAGAAAPSPAPAEAEVAAPADDDGEDDGSTVYERVGGLSAIDGIFDVMYRGVMSDMRLAPLYEKADIDFVQGVYREFLAAATGGPKANSGYSLADVHADVVVAGMSDEHFDASFAHFSAAMEELEVPVRDMASLADVFESTREIVLGRAGGGVAVAPVAEVADAAGDEVTVEEAIAEEAVVEDAAHDADLPAEVAPVREAKEEAAASEAKGGGVVQSLRVNVDVLENLMTVVSELVLTRNQLMQILRQQHKTEFDGPLQRLNQVTSELQEGVMQTRMQPIGNAWSKLPRIIRDLSHELGKKIELEMTGAETELDRQVLDLIKDPLTHMVRNSADHGLELPEERVAAGKPEVGTIRLTARHEGGHIIIEITDDGRGIAIEKIKAKAISNGLTTEADAEAMSDQQILQFIFKPGFSTAQKVTNVSGRGVGMDVVRTNITKIGGTVDLHSSEGEGSRFTIKIPLTLAIVQALIVETGGERFAMPQTSVTELVRTSASAGHQVEMINGAPVLRLRNRLLPLVSLRKLMALEDREEAGDESYVIVTRVGAHSFGIMVEQVFDTEEIVVKPVSRALRHVSMFSGNTILGDGSVIMILDPNGIAAATSGHALGQSESELNSRGDVASTDKTTLLLFRAGDRAMKAFPLELVARLEEFDLATTEMASGATVIQYRDHLMPLITIDGSTHVLPEGRKPVLVFTDRMLSLGLVVDEIVDIVEETVAFDQKGAMPGTLGSAIVHGQATDILDASYFLRMVGGDREEPVFGECAGVLSNGRRILLVDDSPFFRNLLTPLLQSAGYAITAVQNASEAMDVLEHDGRFDIVVSDIEMPGMNGFEFARTLRGESRWRNLSLVALSSHGTPNDIERGIEAGFDQYVTKMDHGALLSVLSRSGAAHEAAA